MHAAQGILTATGGMTSHAAVVARGMGKCCVVGCSALLIDESARTVRVGGRTLREGAFLSLDGSKGDVLLGDVPTSDSEVVRVLTGRLKPDQAPLYQRFERLTAEADGVNGEILNVASGRSETVNDLAEVLGRILERPVEKEFLPERTGDVRHSWADVSAARRLLGYEPEVGFEEGLRLTADAFVGV